MPVHVVVLTLLAGAFMIHQLVRGIRKAYISSRPYKDIPIINLPGKTAKESWIYHGNETIKLGLRTCKEETIFQIMTGTGPKLIIPKRFAEEISRNKSLSFGENFRIDYMADFPGFEGVKVGLNEGLLIRDTVVKKLTQSLGLITGDLVEEASDSVREALGNPAEWESVLIDEKVQLIIARLSSRVFLGKELCRNAQWLKIAEDYTVNMFIASQYLRVMPSLLRPMLHWFVPACRILRKQVRDARVLIGEEVKRREAAASKV
jgi:hypothetical protein